MRVFWRKWKNGYVYSLLALFLWGKNDLLNFVVVAQVQVTLNIPRSLHTKQLKSIRYGVDGSEIGCALVPESYNHIICISSFDFELSLVCEKTVCKMDACLLPIDHRRNRRSIRGQVLAPFQFQSALETVGLSGQTAAEEGQDCTVS